jgi:hypothetical protein
MARFHISQFRSWVHNLSRSTANALYETALAINEGMQEEGKPVTYPINWDSEKQKRAYFATDGFGAGIPYQRTRRYIMSGQVSRQPFGARYFKPHPAGAIGGTLRGWQSKIHAGRWVKHLDVITREVAKLPARILNHVNVSEGRLDASR